tara:strand:- start:24012 stop:24269 length:258 start_codon:yes stop_codon:yes gene_type:complete
MSHVSGLASRVYVKSMGSSGEDRFAAETREVGEAQWRVWEMRRVVGRGWPAVAMMGCGRDRGVREAVCRMCVWGMETVMMIERGG